MDFHRDPNSKALKRRGVVNHGSTFLNFETILEDASLFFEYLDRVRYFINFFGWHHQPA